MFRYCKSDKFTNNSFLRVQKNPRNTRFLGYLTFGHKLSCDNKSIFRLYYSMIVATRPDPTVRPPSRYQTGVLRCANGDFSCDLCGKIRIFRCVRIVLGDFVIMMLSRYLLSEKECIALSNSVSLRSSVSISMSIIFFINAKKVRLFLDLTIYPPAIQV